MDYIKVTPPSEAHPHTCVIELNRPKALNALNTDMVREIVKVLESNDINDDIRCTIITGNERAFAAGADIKAMVEASPIDQYKDIRAALWKRMKLVSKPTIAAVNGFCLGGGHELAMSCDFIIAGDRAKFGQPEINIGTIPGAGGTQRLTKTIGKSKAMLMVLTGEMIDAKTACDLGLVAKVFPAITLLKETILIANKICEKAPIAVRLAKEAVNYSLDSTLSEGLDFERRNFYMTFASKDQKEGMNAFLEKRAPKYEGN